MKYSKCLIKRIHLIKSELLFWKVHFDITINMTKLKAILKVDNIDHQRKVIRVTTNFHMREDNLVLTYFKPHHCTALGRGDVFHVK